MSHQFFLGKCPLELAQGPSRVALAWHKARGSTPFGVTVKVKPYVMRVGAQRGLVEKWLGRLISNFRNLRKEVSLRPNRPSQDPSHNLASQRSLHNAPIFRLLLKVAVNGTHQCDLLNFCGAAKLQQRPVQLTSKCCIFNGKLMVLHVVLHILHVSIVLASPSQPSKFQLLVLEVAGRPH